MSINVKRVSRVCTGKETFWPNGGPAGLHIERSGFELWPLAKTVNFHSAFHQPGV